jgi:hypothetical protein
VVERAHVVQPVGELHQQHADVVGHGEQELAQILRARWLSVCASILLSLVTPSTSGDVAAEQPLDLLARRDRILDRVVEDGGDDRLVIEMQVGENAATSIGWL